MRDETKKPWKYEETSEKTMEIHLGLLYNKANIA